MIKNAPADIGIWKKLIAGTIVPEDITPVKQKTFEETLYCNVKCKEVLYFNEPLEKIM